MSSEIYNINKQGLSGKAIKVIEDATKRAEDKMTAIFENYGVNYEQKNNIIDTKEEKNFFDIEINSSTILTNKEKKQIRGIKEPKAPSDAKLERQEKRADRTDEKASKNYFNEVLETVVNSGVERKDIVNKLKAELTEDNADKDAEEKYNYLIKFVENALNQVKDENFEKISMQQVDEYFANLVLKTKGSTERKILRQVAQMVKNEKINAAKEDITNRYATKVEEAEKKGLEVTDKEIMDEIREELKNENKYIIDNNYGERDQNEYVTAYDAFNNGEIAQNARILLANVITGKTNPDQIDGDKILKEAKQWLKKEGLWDSNVAKAKRKHRFGKNYSDYEGLTRNIALNTIKSEDELKKAFGENADEKIKTKLNKTDEKIRALMNAKVNLTDDKGQPITDADGKPVMFNLITLREDGYYDLTNLSRYIRQQVGSDLTYNEHKHDTNSEGGYLKRGINGAIEGDEYDLSNEEILGLVEACGYDKEGQLYGTIKTILGGTVGALAHGLTAGIATLSNPSQTYLDTPPDMKDMVIETNLKSILDLNDINTLKELGLNITVETDTIIKTTISNILANEEAFIVVMPKLIAENAVKSAVMGGVLGLLAGFQEAEEKPAVPLKVEQTTLKAYNDALKAGKETKKYAPLLTSLALVKGFVSEDGTLDGPGFETYLQRLFAGNDILNKKEFAALEYEFLQTKESRHLKQKPKVTAPVDTAPVTDPKPIENKIDVNTKVEPVVVEKPEEFTWTHEHTWQAVVMAYYPEALGNGSYKELKAAVDAFRDAHGISRQQGIPVGQKSQLVPITIDGVTYEPNKNGSDNMDKALVKYGWNSDFFLQKWDVKLEAPRLTIKEYKDDKKTVYYGVRTNADGTQVKSGPLDSSDAVVKELTPQASSEADIILTITIKDEEGKVKKQENQTIKKVEK